MRITLNVWLDAVKRPDAMDGEFRKDFAAFKQELLEFLSMDNKSFEIIVLDMDQKIQE